MWMDFLAVGGKERLSLLLCNIASSKLIWSSLIDWLANCITRHLKIALCTYENIMQ